MMAGAAAQAADEPALDASALVQRVGKSTVMLQVSRGESLVEATAFIVSDRGLAMTCGHVLSGATGVTAIYPQDQSEVRLNVALVAIDTRRDLALLELRPSAGSSVTFTPLKPTEKNPAAGQRVWTVGYPVNGTASVTSGLVNAVRAFEKLPAAWRGDLAYLPESVWVQTDCPLSVMNEGGPVVNAAGEVVGVMAWRGKTDEPAYFAAAASQFEAFLQNRSAAPVVYGPAKAAVTLAVKSADPNQPRVIALRADQTIPTFTRTYDTTASQVRTAARLMAKGVVCDACNGTGQRVYTVGKAKEFASRAPNAHETERTYGYEYEKKQQACPKCKGTGAAPPPILDKLVTNFADVACRLDDVQIMDATSMAAVVADVTAAAPRLGPSFLNGGMVALSQNRKLVQPQTVAVAVATLHSSRGEHRGVRIAELPSGQIVVLNHVKIGPDVPLGRAVIGGAYAGEVETSEGTKVPVLQDGFIVRLPELAMQQQTPQPAADAAKP